MNTVGKIGFVACLFSIQATAAEKAKDPRDYWALQPVVRPAVPASSGDWVRTPIDAFVERKHQQHNLRPIGPAPRHVLLRRLYLDLTGLPPTRVELHDFLGDPSPDAYEKLVGRLLDSPRYGERWGRHWMDVWRYSDWAGWNKQVRDSQPHIWRWRDWIVKSMNEDKPYDRIVVEMLAGDEMAPADPDVLAATGFLVRNYKMLSREKWMQDTVEHTAQALFGLTLKCARCHDHKSDPISQEDYYRYRAIFEPYKVRIDPLAAQHNGGNRGELARVYDAELEAKTWFYNRGDDRSPDKDRKIEPGVPAVFGSGQFDTEAVELTRDAFYPALHSLVLQDLVDEARGKADKAKQELTTLGETDDTSKGEEEKTELRLAERTLVLAEAEMDSLRARIEADSAKYQDPPADNIEELAKNAARIEHRVSLARVEREIAKIKHDLTREGNEKEREKLRKKLEELDKELTKTKVASQSPGQKYTPLGDVYPRQSSGRRLALARWITSRENPLTARVAVNHIWLRHFGQPLVPSVSDFGANGKPPTHPSLLDWLAAEFVEPSLTLRGTDGRPRWEAADDAPSGWSMKHLHRLIVTSATYRMASTPDESNSALDQDNVWLWRMPSRRMEAEVVRDSVLHVAGELDHTMGGAEFHFNQGFQIKRRSIYFRHAPEKQMKFLKLFDAAAPTECYRRKESIVPQQALALINSPLTIEHSRLVARKLTTECGEDSPAFVAAAFEQVLARPASKAEIETAIWFLVQQSKYFEENASRLEDAAKNLEGASQPSREPPLRARENLVHVLLNHSDFVTIR